MTSLGDVGARGGEERRFEMATKGKKSLSNSEKYEIMDDVMKILASGDKEIIDAFAARIEALAKVVKSEKKR